MEAYGAAESLPCVPASSPRCPVGEALLPFLHVPSSSCSFAVLLREEVVNQTTAQQQVDEGLW